MGTHLERAQLLLEQNRFSLAEKELRLQLASTPNDPIAHSLLAVCLAEQHQHEQALQYARDAVALAPDLAYAHYVLATVQYDLKHYGDAVATVHEAIRLEPDEADYHALLAGLYFDQKKWQAALDVAEAGLRLDPAHINAANLKAMALTRLGRPDEAETAIGATLQRDPENALTHANQGWTLLQNGKHEKAIGHFHEALRLDPELEWAREGLMEALKARHWVYRLLLKYMFGMSRLSDRGQWLVLIGGYLGYLILRGISKANPALAPILWPVLGLYIIFVLMTWIGEPLFNLLLRFNRFGKNALSARQSMASTLVAACLALALLTLGFYLAYPQKAILHGALGLGLFTVPLAGYFRCTTASCKRVLGGFAAGLAALGLTWLGVSVANAQPSDALGLLYLIGVFGYSWLANHQIMRQ